jgi:hypothetical protein
VAFKQTVFLHIQQQLTKSDNGCEVMLSSVMSSNHLMLTFHCPIVVTILQISAQLENLLYSIAILGVVYEVKIKNALCGDHNHPPVHLSVT